MDMDLWLDIDGFVDLRVGEEPAVRLGHVEDAATSYRVPASLLGRLDELKAEWRDMVEFGEDCRATADHAWMLAKGVI